MGSYALLSVCVYETYIVHHLVGTGLCCAPPTCVVHHRAVLCTMVHKGDLFFVRIRGCTRRFCMFVVNFFYGVRPTLCTTSQWYRTTTGHCAPPTCILHSASTGWCCTRQVDGAQRRSVPLSYNLHKPTDTDTQTRPILLPCPWHSDAGGIYIQ